MNEVGALCQNAFLLFLAHPASLLILKLSFRLGLKTIAFGTDGGAILFYFWKKASVPFDDVSCPRADSCLEVHSAAEHT